MRILSATEAISSAIARMKLMLFRPFRLGRSWKLAATGYLGGTASMFLPFPLIYLLFIPFIWHKEAPGSVIAIICSAVAVMMTIYVIIYYLCSRLRFAFFDIVLNRGEFVAPAWRKYGAQSLKWALFKAALGSVFCVLIAVPLVPLAHKIFVIFSNTHFEQGQQLPPAFMQAIFSIYAGILALYLIIGIFALLNSLLSDFVVPSLALENTTLAEAFRRAGRLVRNEPGAVCLYAVIKIAIFLVGGMAVGIFFYIFLFAVILVAFIVGLLAYFVLHLLHVPQEAMSVLGIIAGVLLYISTIVFGITFANGTLYTILESYSLYFLGGRYPLLGDLLDRSTPPTESLPPAPIYGYVPIAPVPPASNTP